MDVIQSTLLMEKTDPSTGQILSTFVPAREPQILAAVARARRASDPWEAQGPVARGEMLYKLAELFSQDRAQLATAIATEHGKPIKDADGEVQRSIEILRFMAGMGRRLGGRTMPSDAPHTFSSTHRRPIGTVALITPWNFPLAIPVWKIAPALVAGCAVLLKPSPLAPHTADLLAELAWQAGIPTDVLQVIQGDGTTGEILIQSDDLAGVSFTGSVATGQRIQALAAPMMKRTQLEMGGKNAVIVDSDADIARAADAIVTGAFGQTGQRCSATSRVIALTGIKEALVDALIERTAKLISGPPDDVHADLGPVISEEALQKCLSFIADSEIEGGCVRIGGTRLRSRGSFMAPTIVDNVSPRSALAQQEVFGPVLAVTGASTLEEAIRLNNQVAYGMSATLFSRSIASVGLFIEGAEAGMLHVNRPGTGAFPHMPHVGSKASQFGAAECSDEAMDFYTEVRTITVDVS